MRRSLLLLSVLVSLGVSPAFAEEGRPVKAPTTLLLSPVAIPVIIDRQMANFIYVTLRLNLSPRADAQKLRQMEPFFRDALLRDAYRTPLQMKADPNRLDEPVLRALVLREGAAVAGAGMVTGVQVIRAQPQKFLPKPVGSAPSH